MLISSWDQQSPVQQHNHAEPQQCTHCIFVISATALLHMLQRLCSWGGSGIQTAWLPGSGRPHLIASRNTAGARTRQLLHVKAGVV